MNVASLLRDAVKTLRAQVTEKGIEAIPMGVLIPRWCPACAAPKVKITDELITCSACGYTRANYLVKKKVTVKDLRTIATEIALHILRGTLTE